MTIKQYSEKYSLTVYAVRKALMAGRIAASRYGGEWNLHGTPVAEHPYPVIIYYYNSHWLSRDCWEYCKCKCVEDAIENCQMEGWHVDFGPQDHYSLCVFISSDKPSKL